MERERFDGADVAHLLLANGERVHWPRLLERFGDNWRVLFAHLALFGFIYPHARDMIPGWVLQELSERVQMEPSAAAALRVCRGTLLSREQFLSDVREQGYLDARLQPLGLLDHVGACAVERRGREPVKYPAHAASTLGPTTPRAGLTLLAKLGLVAKGTVYLSAGLLTLRAAVEGGTPQTNTRRCRTIGAQPAGQVLLVLIGVGLACYALFRLVQAIIGTDGSVRPELDGNSASASRASEAASCTAAWP